MVAIVVDREDDIEHDTTVMILGVCMNYTIDETDTGLAMYNVPSTNYAVHLNVVKDLID